MQARRRRRTKAEIAAAREAAAAEQLIAWATSHGAPVRLIEGWNHETGKWHPSSPVGLMLALVQNHNFPTVAAKLAGVNNLSALLAKGAEYAADAAERRDYIPIEVLPFIDLAREMDIAESYGETDLVKTVAKGAKEDPKLALAFLARRHGSRWREQQAVFTGEDIDERDKAISDALQDPNVALDLAQVAHRIEDLAPTDD